MARNSNSLRIVTGLVFFGLMFIWGTCIISESERQEKENRDPLTFFINHYSCSEDEPCYVHTEEDKGDTTLTLSRYYCIEEGISSGCTKGSINYVLKSDGTGFVLSYLEAPDPVIPTDLTVFWINQTKRTNCAEPAGSSVGVPPTQMVGSCKFTTSDGTPEGLAIDQHT